MRHRELIFPFPKLFGRLADETIQKYNLDAERFLDNLAKISVKNYSNAKRNPNAQTRKWFISEQEAKDRGTPTNPRVGGLLGVTDCSPRSLMGQHSSLLRPNDS